MVKFCSRSMDSFFCGEWWEVLAIELRALGLLGKCSTIELNFQTPMNSFNDKKASIFL